MFKLANNSFRAYSLSLKNVSRNYSSLTANLFNKAKEPAKEFHSSDQYQACTDGKISYATTVSKIPMVVDRVFDQVYVQGEAIPNELAYAFPHQEKDLTFGELKQRVWAMVGSLQALGLQKGERVAFALPNCYELIDCYLAATQLGLIAVVLNPAYQIVELEYMLTKTKAKALFMYDTFKTLNHIGTMQKLCPELESSQPGELRSKKLPELRHIILLNSPLVSEKKPTKVLGSTASLASPSLAKNCPVWKPRTHARSSSLVEQLVKIVLNYFRI